MTDLLRATPFHARAVDANRFNAWENRCGFTLAAHYAGVEEEAVAARFGAAMADISWYWRLDIAGARASEFASRLFTRDASALGAGSALDVLWLNDAGAVRGAGTVLRQDRDRFMLISTEPDTDWLSGAARLYDVTIQARLGTEGVLALIGPASAAILAAAGLDADLPPLAIRGRRWRDIDVSLSRLGLGFEIWCAPDDAVVVWDRLMAAGRNHALLPVGQQALDIVEFESGLMRPGRDYAPARDGFGAIPTPQSLGLCALVDRSHIFNGHRGYLAAGPDTALSGILLDAELPPAGTPLTHQGRVVGHSLSARYSPTMRRAIAFALIDGPWPGRDLEAGKVGCRPVGLPFLPIPGPIGATETAGSGV